MLDATTFADSRGALSALESPTHLPFVPVRVFYLYDLPADAERGQHAHRVQHQLLVCLSGAITCDVDDGRGSERVVLDDPSRALYLPPLTWVTLSAPTPGTAVFVLASGIYEDADYVRDYDEFRRLTHE